jgi:protoheme IX farnesyltransferase
VFFGLNFLATPGFVPLDILLLATLGISLAAGSAAAFNRILEQRVDAIMARNPGRALCQPAS